MIKPFVLLKLNTITNCTIFALPEKETYTTAFSNLYLLKYHYLQD